MTAPDPTRIQIENLNWAGRDEPAYRPSCNRCTWVGTIVRSLAAASRSAEERHPVCPVTP